MDNIVKKLVPVLRVENFEGKDNRLEPVKKNDKIFIPTWSNKPAVLPAAITLDGLSILTHQNLSSIIAPPGYGKSSICESILASFLNPDADCLGFKVWSGCQGVIYIDFERTNLDVWNSFYRMCKRADIAEGQDVEGVQIAGMRSIARLEERLGAIDTLLQNNPCSLLLLDGAGDMVTDTNDLQQAIECKIRLRELTVKYDTSIFTTLHPNPGTDKPRGHIGSEILRESEGVLIVKKGEGDSRIITSDFEHGKNRNNKPITTGFAWSEEKMMFVSIDIEGMADSAKDFKDDQKKQYDINLASIVLPLLQSMTHTQLIQAIIDQKECSKPNAKLHIEKMKTWEIITKGQDGLYRLKV